MKIVNQEEETSSSAQRFKVAVVQASPVVFDRERTLEKVHVLSGEAAHKGARLALFPEAFVSAYPRGLDFGAVIGSRSEEGREDFRRYWESSVDVPGPAVDALSRTARSHSVYLIVGVVERDRGTLYCSVLFFAPDGLYLGKHLKVMPTASERLVWGFGDGSTMPVFDTPLGRIGAVICWENYLPLMRAAMYAKGIEIYRIKPKLAVYTHYTRPHRADIPEVTIQEILSRTREEYSGPLEAGEDLMSISIGDSVTVKRYGQYPTFPPLVGNFRYDPRPMLSGTKTSA